MKKILLPIIVLGLLAHCSKEDDGPDPEPEIISAPKISNLVVDDVTNIGDGRDLEISFKKANDESLITEYRLFVVKSSEKSSFDLSQAEGLSSSNYSVILPTGSNYMLTMSETSTDVNGTVLVEAVEYVVFILSIADGEIATINALSSSSNNITLAQTSIKITYIGNDGVYISDGMVAVVIDALPGGLTGWSEIANGVQTSIERGTGDFSNTKVAMVTHAHTDHVSFTSVNSFLSKNSSSMLIAPPDITPSINSSTQINSANPALGQFEDVVIDGINIKVMHMSHFDAFGDDFSNIINFTYLVELGGLKILHLGDFEYSTANLAPFNLSSEAIDIVLIPALSPFLNAASKTVVDGINAKNEIALHLLSSTNVNEVKAIYPNAEVLKNSLEFVRY